MRKPKYTLPDFLEQFPDDDAALEWLMGFMYPAGVKCHVCKKVTPHHRVKSRKSYCCHLCGHHVHPMAGTIFHKSTTPLRLWLYAIFLMASTRTGVSAKQLERELGVTYKTAWRMFKQIRSMLDEKLGPVGGEGKTVEVDETLLYPRPKRDREGKAEFKPKTIIIGAVERGGNIKTEIIGYQNREVCEGYVVANVLPGSTLYTDEFKGYYWLWKRGYSHATVRHAVHEYAVGDCHVNSIEGFWGNFKTGLRGCYKHCGLAYLPSYLNEYTFRYNRRFSDVAMFNHFLARIEKMGWWVPYSERGPRSFSEIV
ncbi:MAG: IS1595 family transposase [Armatimonadetes bacterium]|nr:IS1595 family transposase [Armatimonadota bacterium]